MYEKRVLKSFKKKGGVALASCARVFALITVNSACTIPYFEPEQPDELKRLKVQR